MPVPCGETEDLDVYLQATYYLDFNAPSVQAFAATAVGEATAPAAQAVRLYYAARDRFLYDPYSITLEPESFKASTVLARGRGNCITKAVVLAAAARWVGIPARLGFADVRNHLATTRLLRMMGTDVFYYHGFAELHLGGRWVKATPAFNIELCRKFNVRPLEFDGIADAIFHPFDAGNRRHMEYINFRGSRPDVPFEEFREAMERYYPQTYVAQMGGDFAREAEAERGGSAEQ